MFCFRTNTDRSTAWDIHSSSILLRFKCSNTHVDDTIRTSVVIVLCWWVLTEVVPPPIIYRGLSHIKTQVKSGSFVKNGVLVKMLSGGEICCALFSSWSRIVTFDVEEIQRCTLWQSCRPHYLVVRIRPTFTHNTRSDHDRIENVFCEKWNLTLTKFERWEESDSTPGQWCCSRVTYLYSLAKL